MLDPTQSPVIRDAFTYDRRRWIARATTTTAGICLASQYCPPTFGQDEQEIPEPQTLPLITKDGVTLQATYYPGLHGKKSIPLVLVHDFRGNRNEFAPLALYLQKQGGYAIVSVDLRGHGESNRLRLPNGTEKTFTPEELKPADFEKMISMDLERVKKFLVEKNNEEQLNVNQTGVIAAGPMGACLALNWTQRDWNWPDVAGQKQGRDVQGMVLLSPGLTFKNLKTADAIKAVGGLSTMLVGGSVEPDMKKLHSTLKPRHPAESADPEENRKQQSLWIVQEETEAKGVLLFKAVGVPLANKVNYFLKLRFTEQADKFAWSERKKPVGN